jgi:hypothetical protein
MVLDSPGIDLVKLTIPKNPLMTSHRPIKTLQEIEWYVNVESFKDEVGLDEPNGRRT